MSKLKRLVAPEFWPIERKTKKYSIMPLPGPHSKKNCIPVGIILRDILHIADNMKDVKEILKKGIVVINGRKRKAHSFPVGFMDVVSVGDEHYRMLVSNDGLYLQQIDSKEAGIRLCRVEDKRFVEGKQQINLHDGTNILADMKCSTGDVLVTNMPDLSVRDVLKLEKNSIVFVTAGHNSGKLGRLKEINVTKSPKPNQAIVVLDDRDVSIPKDFVFVVGREKPVITLPNKQQGV